MSNPTNKSNPKKEMKTMFDDLPLRHPLLREAFCKSPEDCRYTAHHLLSLHEATQNRLSELTTEPEREACVVAQYLAVMEMTISIVMDGKEIINQKS